MIQKANEYGYELTKNNCQDFAVAMFLQLSHENQAAETMKKVLSRWRVFQTLLRVVDEEENVNEDGKTVMARFQRVRSRKGDVLLEYRMDKQQALVYAGYQSSRREMRDTTKSNV